MKLSQPIILASSSPRRKYLMEQAGFTFEIQKPDVDEDFSADMPVQEVAKYLALKKAAFFREKIKNEIVVTADTVVILGNTIMNKPQDRNEACEMLSELAGKTHLVMTGVCITSKAKEISFDDTTKVTFQPLTKAEIEYYVDHHKPFDKAGAYGAQDWIGMIAIQKIEGSYFNVMGLPIHKVYEHLKSW